MSSKQNPVIKIIANVVALWRPHRQWIKRFMIEVEGRSLRHADGRLFNLWLEINCTVLFIFSKLNKPLSIFIFNSNFDVIARATNADRKKSLNARKISISLKQK